MVGWTVYRMRFVLSRVAPTRRGRGGERWECIVRVTWQTAVDGARPVAASSRRVSKWVPLWGSEKVASDDKSVRLLVSELDQQIGKLAVGFGKWLVDDNNRDCVTRSASAEPRQSQLTTYSAPAQVAAGDVWRPLRQMNKIQAAACGMRRGWTSCHCGR